MPKKYFSSKGGTLAKRLDQAWVDYKDPSLSDNDRLQALDFMIYVFDIKKFSNEKNLLNGILVKLMAERASKQQENPHYIPVLSSGKYQLTADILKPTSRTKDSSEPSVQEAFDAGELLDVNQDDKYEDKAHETTYLTPEERADYRVEIHEGLFHKEGKVFDSSKLIAHNKPGFIAFTLNTNGELSAFEHLSVKLDKRGRKLAHSSMNSGAPVLAAGEMEIKNGKLISINTYSGHYQPSLYSVARFLEYLSDRGVDISKTKVYLQDAPGPQSGLSSKTVLLKGDPQPWHEVPATDIVHSVKSIMHNNLNSLDNYLNSSKTKLLRDVFKNDSAQAKSKIAKDFYEELAYTMDTIKDSSSLVDIKVSLDCLDAIIARYSSQLEQLNGKTGRLDSKFADMKAQIREVREKFEGLDERKENERIESFKNKY